MAIARTPYPRLLRARIERDLGLYPAVAIMGARQVGKTTLAREIGTAAGMAYCSLDDQDMRARAVEDPAGLIADMSPNGAVFDEVQRAPDLLLALKAVVDREQRNGRFLLTGSNQPRVKQHVAESLVGRAAYRTLRPLTIGEQRMEERRDAWSWFFDLDDENLTSQLGESAKLAGPLNWVQATAAGGMPRALSVPAVDRPQVLDDYLTTFARRDIRELVETESPEQMEQFMRLVATRTGMELNRSAIGTSLGLKTNRVQRWIDAMERSYLITQVAPFSRNATSRVIKRPKLIMVDPALAMAGGGETKPSGNHFETLVANDLLVWSDLATGRRLHFWRIPSGPEVDFVVCQDEQVMPLEVKGSDSVGRNDARHLARFLDDHAEAHRGVLMSSDPEIRWIRERIIAVPWWSVL
jgi:uncharacterized protein